MFSKGQRVQYKDVSASQELGPNAVARSLAGRVGTVVRPEYQVAGHICSLHNRACTYVEVRFSESRGLYPCHPEHLIPLDESDRRADSYPGDAKTI